MLTQKLTTQVISRYDYPIAQTALGKIRGVEREGLFIFRGIKYANAERFRMPEPVEPWEGVRTAANFGYACPEMTKPALMDNIVNPHFWQVQDENCQYLNIWTNTLDSSAKKPVMFWIHGGGWKSGSSQELLAYDGENLCKFGDVVVVSVNHRLNCLGCLDLSSFGEEYEDSVLVGLADLVEALKWVNKNISVFGGDPDNVMVYGQSGGGSKTVYLMQSPAADGLYNKVCVQSGGAKYGIAPDGWTLKKMSQRVGELTAQALGLTRETIHQIDTIPYYFLAEAAKKAECRIAEECGTQYRWEPIGDNKYCFGSPFANAFRKETLHIPMIVGSVFGEHSSNMGRNDPGTCKNDWSDEETMDRIRKCFGEKSEALVEAFREAYPDHKTADLLYLDKYDRNQFRKFVTRRAVAGGRVWNYLFTFESPYNGGTVAWHCSDLPFTFHNAEYLEPSYVPGVTEKLQDQMAGAWVQFARTGDPNHAGIPFWQPVEEGKIPTMIFDKDTRLAWEHDKKLWDILKEL